MDRIEALLERIAGLLEKQATLMSQDDEEEAPAEEEESGEFEVGLDPDAPIPFTLTKKGRRALEKNP